MMRINIQSDILTHTFTDISPDDGHTSALVTLPIWRSEETLPTLILSLSHKLFKPESHKKYQLCLLFWASKDCLQSNWILTFNGLTCRFGFTGFLKTGNLLRSAGGGESTREGCFSSCWSSETCCWSDRWSPARTAARSNRPPVQCVHHVCYHHAS